MPFAPKPHSALLIVGHGSTENPDSSTPYFEHAEAIRRRGLFAEVHCCFWKEEPSLREAFYLIDAPEVYVVPDFISEGYFTQEVIPRELEITGSTTEIRGRTVHYCLPVGVHPSMTGLILRRAREVAPGVDPAATTLIITGHGTGLNQNSTKAIKDQAALIRESGAGYAAVLDAYMEEAPFIADWAQLSATPNVVVVPFFIADGLHSYQDIPVLLGIERETGAAASQREVFRHNPYPLHGKTLYYSSAIGTEPHLADVILDQVADFDRTHRPTPPAFPHGQPNTAQQLRQAIRAGIHRIGQIEIQYDSDGFEYVLCHVDDIEIGEQPAQGGLDRFHGPSAARELAMHTQDGEYRFIKSQPNLRRGWAMLLDHEDELLLALNHFYPAAVSLWLAYRQGTLQIEHLRAKLQRQTGMYRFARFISDEGAQELVQALYDPLQGAAQKVLWQLDETTPLAGSDASRCEGIYGDLPASEAIPLLSREPSNHLVAACRKRSKAEADAKNAMA